MVVDQAFSPLSEWYTAAPPPAGKHDVGAAYALDGALNNHSWPTRRVEKKGIGIVEGTELWPWPESEAIGKVSLTVSQSGWRALQRRPALTTEDVRTITALG